MYSSKQMIDSSSIAPDVRMRLDAYLRGECSYATLADAILALCRAATDAVWEVLSVIDQYHRRGALSDEVFRSLKTSASSIALGTPQASPSSATQSIAQQPRDTAASRPPNNIDDGIENRVAQGEYGEGATRQAAITKAIVPGKVLHDRYALDSALAFGRTTAVYRAHDRSRTSDAEHCLAVKTLLIAPSAESAAHFENELRIARRVAHPNIVKVFDLDRDGDLPFFTMELIEGQTLGELMQDTPPKRPQALAILTQLANVIAYLHDHDIAHGDINPHNVMIAGSGQVKLLDFGSATSNRSSAARNFPSLGKPSGAMTYASCERLEGLPADKRDDMFSLSCIAYELLAHEHPFHGQLATHARDAHQFPARIADITPSQWRSLQQGLAWHRSERLLSAHAWLEGFGGLDTAKVAAPIAAPSFTANNAAASRSTTRSTTHFTNRGAPGRASPVAPRSRNAVAKYAGSIIAALILVAIAFMLWGVDSTNLPAVAAARDSLKQSIMQQVQSLRSEGVRQRANTQGNEQVTTMMSTTAAAALPESDNTATNPLADDANAASADAASSATTIAAGMEQHNQSASDASVAGTGTAAPHASAPQVENKKIELAPEAHGSLSFVKDSFFASKTDGAARITLKRYGGSVGKVTFSWWPESGTAEAGRDFMSLGKKTEVLENGAHEITVFVPLISGSHNEDRHVFFVEISDPSNGLSLGRITRARVVISDD